MPAPTTARDLWRERAAATPERPFILADDATFTFAEADLGMRRFAAGLRELGIGLGDRVLVGMPNSARTILVHAALRELGAVMVPLLPGLPLPELTFQANHCGARFLVAEDPIAALLVPALDLIPAVDTVATDLAALANHEPLPSPPDLTGHTPDSPAAILYTSGSTGRPKGVVLPGGAWANAGFGYSERFGIDAEDNLLVATPLAHAVGALTKPGMALLRGARMTIVDRFSPARFWDDVERSGSTATVLFPAQLNLLLHVGGGPERGASTLRLVMTHAWMERFRERFGVELGLCWGMTETGAVGAGTPVGWVPGDGGASGTIGPPMDGVELSVRDAAGADVASGEEGELWTRNAHRMLEYLDDPAATAETLVDGWLRTGDRANLDADGWVHYRGRIKNMIKRSGENISPLELETVLDSHPAVAESLIFGIPDELRSEEVVAVASLEAGATAAPATIAAHAAEHLARWKLPRYIRIDEEPLPRLPNGKIDRATVLAGLDVAGCWDARAGAADRPRSA